VDATGFDPGTGLAFSSNGGDGTLTVVPRDSPDKFTVVAQVPDQAGSADHGARPENAPRLRGDGGLHPAPASDSGEPPAQGRRWCQIPSSSELAPRAGFVGREKVKSPGFKSSPR